MRIPLGAEAPLILRQFVYGLKPVPCKASNLRRDPVVLRWCWLRTDRYHKSFMVISPPIQVATIGMGDSLLLMVLALVVLGPRRLPQVGRQIGKLMYEFRKASNDFKFQMEEELRNADEADRRKREEAERQRTLAVAQQAVAQAQDAAALALNAAAQAQSAAQTAQTAAEHSQAPTENAAAPVEPGNIYDNTYAEPAAAESGLRVQPPSTGEPVQAERPGRAKEESTIEDSAGDGSDSGAATGADDTPLKKDVAAEETHAATESTSHHG
jgi:sec-independent protein translocase protein TatB